MIISRDLRQFVPRPVRDEFGEGNDFCKKVTYRAEENPKSVLSQFRNAYNPRIAVTVDMIATGTDVKPLECLLFMRDVKSKNYFEQMKGRGTRVLKPDDLKKVKGIGPQMEKALNQIGIYTFAQVSRITQREYDLLDSITGSFPGRAQRDDWAGQAKQLNENK